MKAWKALALIGTVVLGVTGCSTPQSTDEGMEANVSVEETTGEKQTVQKEEPTSESKEDIEKEDRGEPIVIKMGHHNIQEIDPRSMDPVSGDPTMPIDKWQSAEAARLKVLEELNVDFQFIQYPGKTTEVLLQSVLAGDPICDIALLSGSQGTILAQNILQPLNEYEYIFEGDSEWMLWDEIIDRRFFLTDKMDFEPRWPLIYNINYIEQVEGLKVDGKTVYPTDLFLEGNWTWSVFEQYLEEIDTHFENSKAPNRPERRIDAYQTDYKEAVRHASHANGGGIYTAEGLMIDSPETIEAVNYVQNLMDKGLLNTELANKHTSQPGWGWHCSNFRNGESVFTNYENWRIRREYAPFEERGESLGIVPFPRPDDMAFDDPRYQQPGTATDCVGILKGVSPEQTKTALEAYEMYFNTYYCELGGVEKASDYNASYLQSRAIELRLDIFHPEIGEDILKTFEWIAGTIEVSDYSQIMNVYYGPFATILGDSLYGMNSMPQYEIAIKANKGAIQTSIDNLVAIVESSEIRDNISPTIKVHESLVFPKGVDLSTVDWAEYLLAEDNIDGELDLTTARINFEEVDTSIVGVHEKAIQVTIADLSENEAKATLNLTIYNPENTMTPTLIVKEAYPSIKLDEEAKNINWAKDFIESAADIDGINIKNSLEVDLSQLDTFTPGTYEVRLTVTDYAGNKAEAVVEVDVVKE